MKYISERGHQLAEEETRLKQAYDDAKEKAAIEQERYSRDEISYAEAKRWDDIAIELHKKWKEFLGKHGHEFLPHRVDD
ncbi:hypothetical protein [Legionella feeleii]|uniref:Uncharacterized protein n=1 Tax=Legionella feeleii TaxID=453 RepID=A0A0W0TMX0_9GAMM|nr:hypothetical protein [Legionella feeleii]KTC96938.1 hypothetical protein Lfee_1850 [Legionella feeleii]SPX62434.1 Uncharacterised protein [Legionella feeleii]